MQTLTNAYPPPAHGRWRRLKHHASGLLQGFGCGIVLIVPAVLWITERSDNGDLARGSVAAWSMPATLIPASTSDSTPHLIAGPRPALRSNVAEVSPEPVRGEAEGRLAETLEKARSLIRARDINRAREILEEAARGGDGEVLFLLAETFDPNQLAAAGVTQARAEADRARHLYGEAQAKGVAAAKARLEQLR